MEMTHIPQWEQVEPQVWKAENPGDSIEGVYVKSDKEVGLNKSTMYYLENNGKQIKIWGSTILDDRMAFVTPGDFVKISFVEKRKNSKGQPLKVFKVERRAV